MALHDDAHALLTSVELLRSIGMPEPRLTELRARARGVVERVARRVSGEEGLRAEVEALARELVEVDARMPTTWFRQQVRFDDVPRDALVAYAFTLGKSASDEEQLDRVELIVTRLLSTRDADGYRQPLPEDQAMSVLEAVASGNEIAAARRESAVAFFVVAAERLEGLTTLDAIFDSGLYLDVKGYKRALGKARTDPAVLYAAVLVNIAISNHLHRPGATSADRAPVDGRTSARNKKVPEAYGSIELDHVSQRFEDARQASRPAPAAKGAAGP